MRAMLESESEESLSFLFFLSVVLVLFEDNEVNEDGDMEGVGGMGRFETSGM